MSLKFSVDRTRALLLLSLLQAMAHDFPQVVVETQKLLFNIIMCYPSEILKANQEVTQTTIKVLELQMDCLVSQFDHQAFQ